MKRILLSSLVLFLAVGLYSQTDQMTGAKQGPVETGPVIININGLKGGDNNIQPENATPSMMNLTGANGQAGFNGDMQDIDHQVNDDATKSSEQKKKADDNSNEIIDQVKQNLKVYPVPATTNLTVDLGQEVEANISVMDIIGQTVFSTSGSTSKVTIPVSDLNSGSYFVMIKINDRMITKRVQVR